MLDFSVVISSFGGTIPASSSQVISLAIDRSLVTADGNYSFAIVFEIPSQGTAAPLYGTFIKADTSSPTLRGPTIVAAFAEDALGDLFMSGFTVSDTFISGFEFEALPGATQVLAWTDENGNLEVDAGDYLGVFPDIVNVVANQTTRNVNLNIIEIIDLGAAAATTANHTDYGRWIRTIEELAREQTR
jgi:hypothetical protein